MIQPYQLLYLVLFAATFFVLGYRFRETWLTPPPPPTPDLPDHIKARPASSPYEPD